MKRTQRTPKSRGKKSSSAKSKRPPKISPYLKIFLLVVILFVIIATAIKLIELFIERANAFPKLEISLTDVTTEQINTDPKGIKYPGNIITLTTSDNQTTFNNVEIKGRGNSTWAQPKKPYQLKLSQKINLLGQGPSKKWILLANYFDVSHLRNDIAFKIQQFLDPIRSNHGEYLELFVDNIYYGLYYLTEKTDINKNRINLHDPFGIIVELDNLYGFIDGCDAQSNNHDCLTIKDTVNNDNSSDAMSNFMEKFNQLEFAISAKDYSQISELIDIDSFAKYYLVNEFTNNFDAYSSSFFMYSDGPEDRIHADSGWDFDLSLGSKNWGAGEGIDSEPFLSPSRMTPLKDYLSVNNISTKQQKLLATYTERISTILYDLMDIPEFETRVKEIYQSTLSGKKDELLSYIKSQANYIRPAALRDAKRWKFTTDFDNEVDYLIDWITKRYDHFEETYGAGSNKIKDTTNLLPNDELSNN